MKTIGLLGGLSWQSTLLYYRLLNEAVHQRLRKHHSAKIILQSLDFEEVIDLSTPQRREDALATLTAAARRIEAAGADMLLICSNTIHTFADPIAASISIPLLHIAEIVATHLTQQQLTCAALLGTRYTMTKPFYRQRLAAHHHKILIPTPPQLYTVHDIIFDELVHGITLDTSRQRLLTICQDLKDRGAQAIILGCTELPLLLDQTQSPLPLLDTTKLHALAAVDLALR